jgi:hypothetical protein
VLKFSFRSIQKRVFESHKKRKRAIAFNKWQTLSNAFGEWAIFTKQSRITRQDRELTERLRQNQQNLEDAKQHWRMKWFRRVWAVWREANRLWREEKLLKEENLQRKLKMQKLMANVQKRQQTELQKGECVRKTPSNSDINEHSSSINVVHLNIPQMTWCDC